MTTAKRIRWSYGLAIGSAAVAVFNLVLLIIPGQAMLNFIGLLGSTVGTVMFLLTAHNQKEIAKHQEIMNAYEQETVDEKA